MGLTALRAGGGSGVRKHRVGPGGVALAALRAVRLAVVVTIRPLDRWLARQVLPCESIGRRLAGDTKPPRVGGQRGVRAVRSRLGGGDDLPVPRAAIKVEAAGGARAAGRAERVANQVAAFRGAGRAVV